MNNCNEIGIMINDNKNILNQMIIEENEIDSAIDLNHPTTKSDLVDFQRNPYVDKRDSNNDSIIIEHMENKNTKLNTELNTEINTELTNSNNELKKWIDIANNLVDDLSQIVLKPFSDDEFISSDDKEGHKLKIHCSSYLNTNNQRITKTICEYYVPCFPEQYITFLNNIEEQIKLDNNIAQYTIIDSIMETDDYFLCIEYLSYKKFWPVSARDIVYLKHYRKIDSNTWCDISKSLEHIECPEIKDKIRCDIILSGQIITHEQNYGSKVILYAESNLKLNIPLNMLKMMVQKQVKGYVENVIN